MFLTKSYVKKLTINENSKILDVINNLNYSGKKVVLVNNKNRNFLGIINDGDIRRAIGRGLTSKSSIKNIINKKPYCIKAVSEIHNKDTYRALKSYDYIPVVNNKKILGLYLKNNERQYVKKYNETVVIMGGGFGKRLGKLTKKCPKALLTFKNKPLLEYLIEHIKNNGFYNILISVFFLKEKIKSFIKKKNFFSIKINFLEEKNPLGTIGSIKLIKKISNNFIVINCDVISKINFYEILNFHKKKKSFLTIGVKNFQYKNPYGVVQSKNNKFISLEEKPSINFNINAGIYVFNKRVISIVKNSNIKNIEELIDVLKKKNFSLNTFPIFEDWIDFGQNASRLKVYNSSL